MNASDLRLLSDDELTQLGIDVGHEQALRRIPETMDNLNLNFLDAEGTTPGQEWRQPTGAFDAYPADWEVTHNGKTWVSLTPSNVWEPGVSGWREVVAADAPPPDWVQPTGSTDAYNTGDRVTFEGVVYESVIDANTWSPTAYPAGWKTV